MTLGIIILASTIIMLNLANRAQELCVKVEVTVLGSPSLLVFMVSVDVKKH